MRHSLVTVRNNVVPLAIMWIAGFVLMRIGALAGGSWVGSSLAAITGCVIGMAVALRLRGRVATLLLAGQIAYLVAELAIHARYGIGAAQGAPTHWAVMSAATLGVVLGSLVRPMIAAPAAIAGTPS